jgi:CCR4-NOT transcription complex subunit 1
MSTANPSQPHEIFEGLMKLLKINYENQFKILIAFFYSNNTKFQEAAKLIFPIKCQELFKEGTTQVDKLSENVVQNLLLIINTLEGFRTDVFLSNTFSCFLSRDSTTTCQSLDDAASCAKHLDDIDSLIDTPDDPVELDMILKDLGPLIINNSINLSANDLIDTKFDEKSLAGFILYMTKHQTCVEDKENRYLNKVFLKSLDNDISMTIDENTEKKINVSWNIEAFYKMIKPQMENMDINLIFHYFDDPAFSIKDKKAFEYFITVLQKLKINYNNFIMQNLIFRKWTNELNQIEFLNFLINNIQSELFSFKNTPRKVKKNFELSLTVNKNSVNHLIEAWSSIDLIETLVKLSRGNYYLKIKDMFEWPIANVPELVVLALAQIKNETEDFLYEDLVNEILPLFLGNHINSIVVLDEIWNMNKELVIKTICTLYRSNPDLMNLSRILDITQKLKESLIPIVSCNDHYFTVNLAILAVKRDFLHIDQWLAERIAKIGDDFIECLLNYIKENVIAQCRDVTSQSQKENILEKCQLSLESLAIIFENLTPNKIGKNPKVSKRIEQEITDTYKAIFEIFDELQIQPPNSEEIEEAANKLYKSLFQNQITIEEVVEKMKSYKNSQNQKESEIYACLIHSLLDEYRFFHEYPERELVIMSTLFGQSINQKLLDGIIETIALKYVIEGLKKGSGNMFTFATVALEQFVDKLHNWPQYLGSLINIPTLKTTNNGLYERVLEKYNEVNNKSKLKEQQGSDGKIFNPIVSNYINFEPGHPEVGPNKSNLSKVSKMPDINKNEFNMNFTNSTTGITQAAGNNPVGLGFNQPYMPVKSGVVKTLDYQNIAGFYPEGMYSAFHPKPNEFIDDEDANKDVGEFYKFNKIEDYKLLKQDLEVGSSSLGITGGMNDFTNPNQSTVKPLQNFNSGDKASFNYQHPSTKIKLPKPTSGNTANLNQIFGEGNESTVQAPPQEVVDKINFIFNSMSKNNITEKSNELKLILSNENIIKWFSNFFIVNRVSAENNNHQNYNELISHIDSKELNNLLYKDTVSFIKRLLLSENIAKDSKEKNVLKNLGSWLGIMTLAKNKPILAKDLDLKEIIFDAYENGKLGAIITFICRILDNSAKTKVFHPKNPWIQAILSVIAELYYKPHLKNPLKFEIEKIFKTTLELDLNNFPQSRLLDALIVCKDSPDFPKV